MKPLRALVLVLAAALPLPAAAEWVRATGSVIFPPEMSEAEACQQAENRARADAVRQVTGETLSADDTMRCTERGDEAECARNSTVWISVGGDIRQIRARTAETHVEMDVFRKCTVSFEADIHVAQGRPDPGFDIGVALNQTVFRDGEALVVSLKPSQPMAVQIFQWLPYEKGDAQVSRVFPNAYDAQARLDRPSRVPSKDGGQHYDLRLRFPAGQPAERKMVDEYLMVVATRTPLALRESYTLDEFNRAVAEIPLGDRRLVRRAYAIVRGGE